MAAVQTSVGSALYEFEKQGQFVGRFRWWRGLELEVAEGIDPLLFVATAISDTLGRSGGGGDGGAG